MLHWYLSQIADNNQDKEEYKAALCNDGVSKFTYETRPSSTDFCNALMMHSITILEDKKRTDNYLLSKIICNSQWFFLSWLQDPTIKAMLTMIDDIDKKINVLKDKKLYLTKLLNLKNRKITFLFLDLEEQNLSDKLYIKMNSRGKILTDFENFKAKYEQYLKNCTTQPGKYFLAQGESDTLKEVSIRDYFINNIETKWSYLFFNYRKQNIKDINKNNTFDEELMNFIRIIFTNQYASTAEKNDDTLEYLLGTKIAKSDENYMNSISFVKYVTLNAISNESTVYLIDAFDAFSNGKDKIKSYLLDDYKLYFNEVDSFEKAIHNNFENYSEQICFHAYVQYLIRNKNNLSGINEWMRVVYNLSNPENTKIDGADDFLDAIHSVNTLLEYCDDILSYLRTNPDIKKFSKWQSKEEIIKAFIIIRNDNWKKAVESFEKNRYFNGQIGFLLQFAGVIDYYNENGNCSWSEEEDKVYFTEFMKYSKISEYIFNGKREGRDFIRTNDNEFIFERAVLVKGDHMSSASYNRYNLHSVDVSSGNIKRDHSWKRLLRIENSQDMEEKKSFIKQVFDDKRMDINNIDLSLKLICKDKTNTWRDLFVQCPDMIRYCGKGYIYYRDENDIRLYTSIRSDCYQAELYTYYLYKTKLQSVGSLFTPFKVIRYVDALNSDQRSYIELDFNYSDEIKYKERIYYNKSYYIMLLMIKDDVIVKDWQPAIVKYFNENNITEDKENIAYDIHFYYKDDDDFISQLCESNSIFQKLINNK